MAAEVRQTQPVFAAAGPQPVTADQRYWASFGRSATVAASTTAVTSVTAPSHNSATGPNAVFAVTTAARIQLFSCQTRQLVKSLARVAAGAALYSGVVRSDGKLVAAGTSTGLVQLFDAGSRAIVRTWKEHGQAVRTVRWHPTAKTTILSASDDGTVKVWDIAAADKPVGTWQAGGGGEYVRTAEWLDPVGAGTSSGSAWATGSYDSFVRIWDSRVPDKAVMQFKFADPIEAVLPLAGGTRLCAASGPKVGVLDLVAAKPVTILKNHGRNVVALASASGGTRVLSAGLDGHVKVFEASTWTVVAAFKYPSPVLSVAVVPGQDTAAGASELVKTDRHLLVGLQSGVLSVRSRMAGAEKAKAREKKREMDALLEGKLSEFDKRRDQKLRKQGLFFVQAPKKFIGEGADVVIEGNPRGKIRKLPEWDNALRRCEYARALDLVLDPKKPTDPSTLAVFTALRHRSALRTAIANRTEDSLQPVLRWLIRALCIPRLQELATDVGTVLVDEYAVEMGSSAGVGALLSRVHETVRQNVELATLACATAGMVGLLG